MNTSVARSHTTSTSATLPGPHSLGSASTRRHASSHPSTAAAATTSRRAMPWRSPATRPTKRLDTTAPRSISSMRSSAADGVTATVTRPPPAG